MAQLEWTLPKVERLKEKCPYHKCPVCGQYGFKKGEVVMLYLRDVFQNKFQVRYAHILCAMRGWDVFPQKKLWREAQNINLLEAV